MSADEAQSQEEPEGAAWRTAGTMSWTWTATVTACVFREAFEAAAAVTGECRVAISPDALRVTGVDPSNVACMGYERECVQEDGIVGVRMGIRPYELVSVLPEESTDHEYTLTVNHDPDGDTLEVSNGEGSSGIVEIQHPETVRRSPDVPTPDDPVDVFLEAPYVRGVLGALSDTECDVIHMWTKDGEIAVRAREDGEDTWQYPWKIPANDIAGDAEALYSLDYIGDVVDALRPDEPVRVRFADDRPIRFDQDHQAFAVAPRIRDSSDEENGGDE